MRPNFKPVLRLAFWALIIVYYTLVGGQPVGLFYFPLRVLSHAITALILFGWLVRKLWRKKEGLPCTPLDLPILGVLLVTALTTLVSAERRLGVEQLLLVCSYVLFYYLMTDVVARRGSRDDLLAAIALVGIVIGLAGVAEYLNWYLNLRADPAWSTLGLGWLPPQTYRVGLLLANPNSLALYLVVVVPLIAAWALNADSWPARAVLALAGLPAVITLVLTFSRGGWLGMTGAGGCWIVAGIVTLAHRWRALDRRTRFLSAGTPLVVIALLAIVIPVLWQGMGERAGSNTIRQRVWSAAWKAMLARPLTGYGPATFPLSLMRYRDPQKPVHIYEHALSTYLNLGAEQGAVGLLALAAVGVMAGISFRRAWRHTADVGRRVLLLASVSSLIGLSIHGAVDNFLHRPAIVLPALFALAVLAVEAARAGKSRLPTRSQWATVGLMGLAVITVGAWVWTDGAYLHHHRAVVAAAADDWAMASQELEAAVRWDPAYTFYHHQLGRVYGELAMDDPAYLPRAIAAYRWGHADNDFYALNHASLAALYGQAGDWEQAVQETQRAVALDPYQPVYSFNLGLLLAPQGLMEEAYKAYAQTILLSPPLLQGTFWRVAGLDEAEMAAVVSLACKEARSQGKADALQTEGELLYYSGDFVGAERVFQRALSAGGALQPAEIHDSLGLALLAQGRTVDALAEFNMASELAPAWGSPYLHRGQVFLQSGDLARAEHELTIALFWGGGAEGYYTQGEIARQRGDLEAASQAYHLALRGSSELNFYFFSVGKRTGVQPEHVPQLVWIAPDRTEIQAALALAGVEETLGHPGEAKELYQRLLDLYPWLDEVREELERLEKP